jgi:hypothetical protein
MENVEDTAPIVDERKKLLCQEKLEDLEEPE